jgi:dipeptidyl aminopeptidase/acylaminoacyl peptidase
MSTMRFDRCVAGASRPIRVVLLAALAVGAGSHSLAAVEDQAADAIGASLDYRSWSSVRISPDGLRIAAVATRADLDENVSDSDIWIVDLDSSAEYRLTRGPKRDDSPEWSPDGRTLAFLSDRDDGVAIWTIAPDGGEARRVTSFEKLKVASFRWLPDASGFVLTAVDPVTEEEEKQKKDKRDARVIDQALKFSRLYRFTLGDDEPVLLTEDDLHVSRFDVAPDGSRVVFSATETASPNDRDTADLFTVSLEGEELRPLVEQAGPDTSPRYSPDGDWIAFASAGGSNNPHINFPLYRVRSDGTGVEELSSAFDERVSGHRWSSDGASIYFRAFEGVASRVFRLDVASREVVPGMSHDANGVVTAFDVAADASFLTVAFSDPMRPGEIFRFDLEDDGFEALTSANASFAEGAAVAERFSYSAADGWPLEGVLIRPHDYAGGRRPLIVVAHGGPSGVHTLAFRPSSGAWPYQALVDEGFLLFLPNPRGSTGFGESFRKAVVKDWGGGDYRDIMRGVDLLVERGTAHADGLGIMGWSYGGYMTAWIVSQTDRFRAAIVGAGITDAIRMYGTQDMPDYFESHFGDVKPWEDPDGYLSRSAIRFVGGASTPTLFLHGAEDKRVPLGQAQEMYTALKQLQVETEMVVYPRQGHGIREPRLREDAMRRTLDWMRDHILPDEAGGEGATPTTTAR